MDFYKNQHILVLGLGVSGLSAVKFLLDRGAIVTGADKKMEQFEGNEAIERLKIQGLHICCDSDPLDLSLFKLMVISPGISSTHPLYQSALEKGIEVIGEIELACRHVSQPFVGITGTNGKTTVALLIGHVLNNSGRKAQVLGNVGTPLTSQISNDSDEVIVCELSSYQLETLKEKIIDCGLVLNITPDHLDRYKTMEDYAKAKISMKNCLKEKGTLYVGKRVLSEFSHLFNEFSPKTIGFESTCDVQCDKKAIFIKENIEMILPDEYRGKSNLDVENIMAAFALCSELGVTSEDFLKAIETFKKPPHRIEFIKTISGVHFYNDSKGTNVDAVIKAVQSMSGKIILIAGGVPKGATFTSWIPFFIEKVKAICAIGEATAQLKSELSQHVSVRKCDSLENAVKKAFSIAEEEENVLLSPGCASLDMFKNFEHRGDCFKEIVLGLGEKGGVL